MTETIKRDVEELAASYLKLLDAKLCLIKNGIVVDSIGIDEQMDEIISVGDFTPSQLKKINDLSERLRKGEDITYVLKNVWGNLIELKLTFLPDKTFIKFLNFVSRDSFYDRISTTFDNTLAGKYGYIDKWLEHKRKEKIQELSLLFKEVDADFDLFYEYFFDEIDARPKDVSLTHILNSYAPESFRGYIEKALEN